MSWLEEYRTQFPAAAECVYLDNAYAAKKLEF